MTTLFNELEIKLREVVDILEKINNGAKVQTEKKETGTVMIPKDSVYNMTPKANVAAIGRLLRDLGIPTHIKGYNYLLGSIAYVIENEDVENGKKVAMTKELYPAVAKMYATTWNRVERAIRHAMLHCMKKGDPLKMEALFGHSFKDEKLTNSQFVKTLAYVEGLRR